MEVFEKSEDKGPISLLLNWFIQLSKHGSIPKGDIDKLERIYEDKEEVKAMLIEALEKEKKEIFERGLLEGEIKGEIKGGIKGGIKRQKEIARNMIIKGFDLSLIANLTGLPGDEIYKLKQELDTQKN